MTPVATYPITGQFGPLGVSTAMCAERSDQADYECFAFDDGSIRVLGTLPIPVREALLRTHVEGGQDPEGRVTWYPKEAGPHDA